MRKREPREPKDKKERQPFSPSIMMKLESFPEGTAEKMIPTLVAMQTKGDLPEGEIIKKRSNILFIVKGDLAKSEAVLRRVKIAGQEVELSVREKPVERKPKEDKKEEKPRAPRKESGEINIRIGEKKREERPKAIIVDLAGKPEGTGEKLIEAFKARLDFCQMKVGGKGDLLINCPADQREEALKVIKAAKVNNETLNIKE